MQNRTEGSTITVPVPLHPELRRGTLMSIIRQSGLAKTLFETGDQAGPYSGLRSKFLTRRAA